MNIQREPTLKKKVVCRTVFSVTVTLMAAGALPAQDAFSGTYLGGALGSSDADGVTDSPLLAGGTEVMDLNPGNGGAFGVFGGYNLRQGDIIYGFEAGYVNLSGLGVEAVSGREDTEVSEVFDLSARLGYAAGDWMVYGALGWSVAHLHVHPGIQFGGRPNTTNIDGASIGIGVEYKISRRWTAAADWKRRKLSGDFSEASSDTDVDLDTLMFRIAYSF